MNDNYTIKNLTIKDYDQLISLWQASGLPFRPKGRDSKEDMAREMSLDDNAFIGMFENERLIGAILATSDGRKGWINRLAIDPEYRHRGLAVMLIEEAEAFLDSLGLQIYAALIEDYNIESKSLFTKVGYVYSPDIHYFSKRVSSET